MRFAAPLRVSSPAKDDTEQRPECDHQQLGVHRRQDGKHCDGNKGDGRSLTIWAQTPRHIPHRLCDHRDCHQFQAVDQALPRSIAEVRSERSKADKQENGWQGEATPRGQTAEPSRSHKPDRKSHLTAGRAREKLAQRYEVGVGLIIEPTPVFDELTTEIAEMSDRAAK
ncbi:hypothetical protein KCU90_g21049, partial [Aureobasidium melanogenum]